MLPFLNSTANRAKKQVVAFKGINFSDRTTDGELRDCLNMSTRRFPYLAQRRGRVRLTQYSNATALTARGTLVVVQGTDLLYDGEVVGQVVEGEKQFAVVNTKMVIWPDKVYLDLNSKKLSTLGALAKGTGATFTDSTIKVTGWSDFTTKFSKGDAVMIGGCSKEENNKEVILDSVSADKLTFSAGVFTATNETGEITIERRVPDLDFICESENRLWGCNSKEQTVYASAQGDPTNFYVYAGKSTDGYALAIGTEGDFTGCCKQGSSVLFWKETKLHKILGSYPAEYTMYTYDMEGLQNGCHKSLQSINEVLYYQGIHGIYSYTGGLPTLISEGFGIRSFKDGVAGNDGDSYYLAVKEGDTNHLFVYETRTGLWMREDDTEVVDFARIGKDLYFLNGNGDVWLADGGYDDPELPWMAQFVPFHETIEGRKRFSKLTMRVDLPRGAWMKVETSCDGAPWQEACKILGRDMDSVPVRLPINRCDRLELRLSGAGPCAVKAMILEYSVGSDV